MKSSRCAASLLAAVLLKATLSNAFVREIKGQGNEGHVGRVPPIDLFVSGQGGYHTYRIPAMVVSPKGTVLVFCEARKTSRHDYGDIDLVVRRSTDGGATWSPMRLLHEEGGESPITIGNPCPVVDQDIGTIWLPFCHNNRDVFVTSSQDGGVAWSEPRCITEDVCRTGWLWVATGPGHGIQLRSGRLLIPCDHSPYLHGDQRRGPAARSHVIYSDDHGQSWRLGGLTEKSMHECQAVQLADGQVLLSMRNYVGLKQRAFATSPDDGLTWTEPEHHPQVYCPVCQAGLLRLREGAILYCGPGGPGRTHLTVRVSEDGGKTWPTARVLVEGASAYSDLARLPNGKIACICECGSNHPYERIAFARFPVEWLACEDYTSERR